MGVESYIGRNFRERLGAAFPIWSRLLKKRTTYKPLLNVGVAAGAAAGAIAVTDSASNEILAGDQLVAVLMQSGTSPYAITNVTAEFFANTVTVNNRAGTIAVDGYINNTGGTTTAGNVLIVYWLSWEDR